MLVLCAAKLIWRSFFPAIENLKETDFPFAAFPVPPKTANAAGEFVVVARPFEAFMAVPVKPLSSVAAAHELEPSAPFRYKVPLPTFALKTVGVLGDARTAVPPVVVV